MIILLSGPAWGQEGCEDRDALLEHLRDKFQEQPVAFGVTSKGGLVEVIAGKETWTLVVSMPDGRSCMIAEGQGWRQWTPESDGPDT